ncbi:MAG: hypothetical protein EBR79_04500, partial [Proteobacteria bacterium]|nr:hypothetical protein [Pseudomonadota bacterium]
MRNAAMDIASQTVDSLGTSHHLLVAHCYAVVDESLGLGLDGGCVAAHLRELAAPHQQASCETQAGG